MVQIVCEHILANGLLVVAGRAGMVVEEVLFSAGVTQHRQWMIVVVVTVDDGGGFSGGNCGEMMVW